ncbi:hypothetical protein K469DRAFT_691076 [Zopfia rhizophila CBS 207.26]|uniref:Zinc finger C3HC4 RING-type domain-containing protein n=1 Tax=Zopfia rhizophila CBS 207.26 TaxID=1314779 RepID=A0A6A6ES06_9PEZI|nr:hypothetical protein K469DRAFT_691076 [Zopfia rhizophila CBS 207.26]
MIRVSLELWLRKCPGLGKKSSLLKVECLISWRRIYTSLYLNTWMPCESGDDFGECDICTLVLKISDTGADAEESNQQPVKMQNCNHVFGHDCLRAWLNSGNDCRLEPQDSAEQILDAIDKWLASFPAELISGPDFTLSETHLEELCNRAL